MAVHVFVEGATDASPAGIARLADAMANHYGLPAADLLARLQKGRFRVKANTDEATAEQYRRDLVRLGARCTIEAADGVTPTPVPAMPRTQTKGNQQYQSGLAAAFSGDTRSASLGALEQDSAAFSLASIDGAEDQVQNASAFAPPASIGPPVEKPRAPAPKPKPEAPSDLFAPPDAETSQLAVDIAADELDHTARKRATPPAVEPTRPSSPQIARTQTGGRPSSPLIARTQTAGKSPPAAEQVFADAAPRATGSGLLADPRARFTAGVFLAVVLGFVPAHFVGAMREASAYQTIDTKVKAAQQLADTRDAWATLDRMRVDQLDRKYAEQRNAAILAFVVWALVGGGLAFVWFKKIPWDRFE